jgi:hypothetical protein
MPLGPTRLGFVCPKLWFISKNIAGVVVNSAINTDPGGYTYSTRCCCGLESYFNGTAFVGRTCPNLACSRFIDSLA